MVKIEFKRFIEKLNNLFDIAQQNGLASDEDEALLSTTGRRVISVPWLEWILSCLKLMKSQGTKVIAISYAEKELLLGASVTVSNSIEE